MNKQIISIETDTNSQIVVKIGEDIFNYHRSNSNKDKTIDYYQCINTRTIGKCTAKLTRQN